jgi:hypothetical protein
MAHDRVPPGDQAYGSTPYPPYDYYPDPRQYQSPNPSAPPYQHPELPRPRSRDSSTARDEPRSAAPEQPIYNAVNKAFDNAPAVNQLPDEVIQQITEQVRSQVINSLKAEGIASPGPPASATPQTQQPFSAPPPQSFPVPQSFPPPPQSPSTSNNSRPIHTPPSPTRRSSNGSSLPDTLPQDPQFSDNGNMAKEDLSSRYGERSHKDDYRRPSPSRTKTDDDETVVEKMWQPLFDSNGEPTPRLGQFLRGLALHLVGQLSRLCKNATNTVSQIEDYEPKKTLVIAPSKLKQFYDDVKLQEETYPWNCTYCDPLLD